MLITISDSAAAKAWSERRDRANGPLVAEDRCRHGVLQDVAHWPQRAVFPRHLADQPDAVAVVLVADAVDRAQWLNRRAAWPLPAVDGDSPRSLRQQVGDDDVFLMARHQRSRRHRAGNAGVGP